MLFDCVQAERMSYTHSKIFSNLGVDKYLNEVLKREE